MGWAISFRMTCLKRTCHTFLPKVFSVKVFFSRISYSLRDVPLPRQHPDRSPTSPRHMNYWLVTLPSFAHFSISQLQSLYLHGTLRQPRKFYYSLHRVTVDGRCTVRNQSTELIRHFMTPPLRCRVCWPAYGCAVLEVLRYQLFDQLTLPCVSLAIEWLRRWTCCHWSFPQTNVILKTCFFTFSFLCYFLNVFFSAQFYSLFLLRSMSARREKG